ncbi:MAG: hypothetical protein IJX51_01660 [Clostridia bacterium]|nr:hypothetical protein [Clostridia bacterium]
MKYRDQVVQVLEEMGILIESDEYDVNLQDFIVDSIQFITFIVNVEEKLNLTFPDEYLNYDNIETLHKFCEILENI